MLRTGQVAEAASGKASNPLGLSFLPVTPNLPTGPSPVLYDLNFLPTGTKVWKVGREVRACFQGQVPGCANMVGDNGWGSKCGPFPGCRAREHPPLRATEGKKPPRICTRKVLKIYTPVLTQAPCQVWTKCPCGPFQGGFLEEVEALAGLEHGKRGEEGI